MFVASLKTDRARWFALIERSQCSAYVEAIQHSSKFFVLR